MTKPNYLRYNKSNKNLKANLPKDFINSLSIQDFLQDILPKKITPFIYFQFYKIDLNILITI